MKRDNKKLVKRIIYDDYNSKVRSDQATIGTITSTVGHSALRSSYKIIEIYERSNINDK